MNRLAKLAATLSPLMLVASCGNASSTDGGSEAVSTPAPSEPGAMPFAITEHGSYDQPWASAFIPGTPLLFITERRGTAKIFDTSAEYPRLITVSGLPDVAYGGQGGLGDVAFLPSESAPTMERRTIYLSFAEPGSGNTRGAALGKGSLYCGQADECEIENFEVVWRQSPKVTGEGHYSHRLHLGPDERYLFVTSGDRQKQDPAQDLSNNLGSFVRLNLDGTPAAGNPFGSDVWSYGHRNILGLDFDAQGRLWGLEHGPKGGDELNLIQRGANYGWPVRSGGVNYNGTNIPDHSPDDGFTKPVINWTPVIAPGNMTILDGTLFADWKGDAIISGLATKALIRVEFDGETAREVARYDMGERIRSVIEGPDGALWVLEDGEGGRLLQLRPQ